MSMQSVVQPLEGLRPQRHPQAATSPFNSRGRRPMVVVGGVRPGDFLQTSAVGAAAFDLADGSRTVAEISAALHQQGLAITPQRLEQFFDLCAAHQLLEPGSWRSVPATERKRGGYTWSKLLFKAHYLTETLMRRRRWWFNPLTIAAGLGLMMVAIAFVILSPPQVGRLWQFEPGQPMLMASGLILAAFLVEIAFHELAHALACQAMGARPGGYGVGLLWWVLPVFFTDTSDSYRIDNKYRRAFIAAAGPLVDLMALGLCGLVVWTLPEASGLRQFAATYATIPLSLLLFNLNPLLARMDGYWIATALLEQPNLRQATRQLLRERWLRLRGKPVPPSLSAGLPQSRGWRIGLSLYGLLALVWTIGFVTFFGFTLLKALATALQQAL